MKNNKMKKVKTSEKIYWRRKEEIGKEKIINSKLKEEENLR